MKPRIIILIHYLELGGAEMSLIGLLNALNPEKVDVDLFVYSHQGPLMSYIPSWINLLPEVGVYSVIERPMTNALKRGHFGIILGRLFAKWKYNSFRKKHLAKGDDIAIMQYVGDYVTPFLPQINPDVEYDLCISYLTPHNIGLHKVNAKKRLAWIHTDYSTVSIDAERELPIWSAYDFIASISPDVTRSFLTQFPSLEQKISPIENILSMNLVKERANEFDASSELKGKFNILSIGRFCTAKNYDNVPDIARRIIDKGIDNFKWYIIGYGSDEALIRKRITETGMQKYVIILGKKENPYPYIKACDVYVQPSRYEGKSVTVREAQMLCKPVVITAYSTASSQVCNGKDGVIVPLDNEECAKGLVAFISDKQLQESIVCYLQTKDYSNMTEVEKIYDLIRK